MNPLLLLVVVVLVVLAIAGSVVAASYSCSVQRARGLRRGQGWKRRRWIVERVRKLDQVKPR